MALEKELICSVTTYSPKWEISGITAMFEGQQNSLLQ